MVQIRLQLHNDVPIMHVAAMLNMVKSRLKVKKYLAKVIYAYAYNLSNLLLTICFNNCPVFIQQRVN